MKYFSKIITLILSLIMLIGLFSLGVFAEGEYTSSTSITVTSDALYSVAPSPSNGLSKLEKDIYDFIANKIVKVADGSLSSTTFNLDVDLSSLAWTKSEIGCTIAFGGSLTAEVHTAVAEKVKESINFSYIIRCLLSDYPFELFWYDKTIGVEYGYEMEGNSQEIHLTNLHVSFSVSADYRSGDVKDYKTDPSKIASAVTVLSKVESIIEKYKDKSDLEKLKGYRDEICNLVSYNMSVLEGGYSYGNPWQIIYVFDGNSSTNVVCEGYAKAFKYLCDLTDFEDEIYCYLISGELRSGGSGEGHMWNVVSINGVNYLVDITNYDGYSYSRSDLFLGGASSADGGITYRMPCGLTYIYYESQMDFYCEGYLILANSAYHLHSYSLSWKTNNSQHWHQCSCGDKTDIENHVPSSNGSCMQRSTCTVCGVKYGSLFSHNYNQKITDSAHKRSDATCAAKATYYYTCSCGAVSTDSYYEDGKTLPHSFTEMKVEKKYIASPGTCVSGADYYYSCTCGAIGEETFETDEKGNHDFVNGACKYCGEPGENPPPSPDVDPINPYDDPTSVPDSDLSEEIEEQNKSFIELLIEFIIKLILALLGIE